MILREARLDDFEVFKRLYEDTENLYQILYICKKENNCTSPTDKTNDFDEESISKTWRNYTLEQFEKDIKSSFIYMIEDYTEIHGYISIFYCGSGKYKIAEWAMFNPDNTDKKIEVLNCLKTLTLPRIEKFSISTINDEIALLLISNGFYSSDTLSFYNLDIV